MAIRRLDLVHSATLLHRIVAGRRKVSTVSKASANFIAIQPAHAGAGENGTDKILSDEKAVAGTENANKSA